MQRALEMVITHSLGREAARKRLQDGLHYAMEKVGPYASKTEHSWSGDDLVFSVTALGATAAGTAVVQDAAILISTRLPLMLAPFASQIRSFVEGSGQAYFNEAT